MSLGYIHFPGQPPPCIMRLKLLPQLVLSFEWKIQVSKGYLHELWLKIWLNMSLENSNENYSYEKICVIKAECANETGGTHIYTKLNTQQTNETKCTSLAHCLIVWAINNCLKWAVGRKTHILSQKWFTLNIISLGCPDLSSLHTFL